MSLRLSRSSNGCVPRFRQVLHLGSMPHSQIQVRSSKMSMPSTAARPSKDQGTRVITLGQAIREALAEEMRRDPHIFILGEDVAEAGTPFKVLSGLVEEFGPSRVIDSPI